MGERSSVVTINGNPLSLLGPELKIGDKAPDFETLDNDLKPVHLSDFKNKILLIASVPSLDTSVCDLETRRFNNEAGNLNSDIQILTISMDLPFAQKRWCGAAGVDKVMTLSDHKEASFGMAYGVLIKELRLLARAIFVVDRGGTIRYIQIVNEVTQEPEYEKLIDFIKTFN
jgi:thioredoxin-dependent peroxiredoxin